MKVLLFVLQVLPSLGRPPASPTPCSPSLDQIDFLRQSVRDPVERLLNRMMADLKERGSVASVVTMAVTEIVQRRDEVVERRLSFHKEKFLSRCSGKVEEQRRLKGG